MDKLFSFLSVLALKYSFLKFLIIGLAVIIHGETGIILFIFLFKEKVGWGLFFLIALTAIIIYESSVYVLGSLLRGTRLGSILSRKIKNHHKLEQFLKNGNTHLIVFSRFVMYFSLAVVFLSGWTRIGFIRFLKLRFIAALIWLSVMTAIIYSLTFLFGSLGGENILIHLELIVSAVILVVVILSRILSKALELKSKE